MANQQYIATQPNSIDNNFLNSFVKSVNSSQGWLLLFVCCVLLGLSFFSNNKGKNKLANGHFAGAKEIAKARSIAYRQIEAAKHNEVAYYLDRPEQGMKGKNLFFLPDMQMGATVMGGPGTGKTDSAIEQLILSALDQGFPTIVYDFKYPKQTERISGYAAKRGYDVRVFAPGYPESEVCNPLDFLKDEADSLMARQFAEVMNRNFQLNKEGNDPFFTAAGDQLTEAILMLTKGCGEFADLMTSQAFLTLDNLPARIRANRDKLNPWVYNSFAQFISVADSEKTTASILATANANFTRFMKADILPAFIGRSTIPLDLEGKQLLILGVNREKRDVLAPIVATILDLIIARNVIRDRQDPLCLFVDELPTLYLPRLPNWLNENREDGLVTTIAFQALTQLEKIYGKETTRTILAGTGTKLVFNPREPEAAEYFSSLLEDEEIMYKQKSVSRNDGKRSISTSEQRQTKKLFDKSRLLKLSRGQCLIISPGFQDGKEAYLPVLKKIHLSAAYKQAKKISQQVWQKIHPRLIARNPHRRIIAKDMSDRYELVEKVLSKVKGDKNFTPVSLIEENKLDGDRFVDLV